VLPRFEAPSYHLFPKSILFYRDGVSETQYGIVLYKEKGQIINGAKDGPNLPWSAKQRCVRGTFGIETEIDSDCIHEALSSRFLLKDDVDPSRRDKRATTNTKDKNLQCVMVADMKAAAPNHFSFCLRSDGSQLATARNCLYVVLCDDVKFTTTQLQEIVSCHTTDALQ
jgi:hypothetical protein